MDNRVAVRFRDDVEIVETTRRRWTVGGDERGKEETVLTVFGAQVEPIKDGRYLVDPNRAERFARDGVLVGEGQPDNVARTERGTDRTSRGSGRRKAAHEDDAEDRNQADATADDRELAGVRGSGEPAEPSGRRPSDVGKTRQQLARQANARGSAAQAKTGGSTRKERKRREVELAD